MSVTAEDNQYRPDRKPAHPAIDEALIEKLVRHFYTRIQHDEVLGPIFTDTIAGDWEPHLQKMMAFWSSVTLMTGRYKGQPMQKHFALKQLKPEHFGQWLKLFQECADEVCEPEVSKVFESRAHNIARSLQLGLFGVPELSVKPSTTGGAMKTLPNDVLPYSRSPTFTETTVPASLQKDHKTKSDVWGVINILDGQLRYTVTSKGVDEVLEQEKSGIIEPDTFHQIQVLGPVSFYVEFYR